MSNYIFQDVMELMGQLFDNCNTETYLLFKPKLQYLLDTNRINMHTFNQVSLEMENLYQKYLTKISIDRGKGIFE